MLPAGPDGSLAPKASSRPSLSSCLGFTETRTIARFDHEDDTASVSLTPDRKWLVAAGGDSRVVFWDVVTQAKMLDESLASAARAVGVSPSASYFPVGDADSFVTLWNARSSEIHDGQWKCHVRCRELRDRCCRHEPEKGRVAVGSGPHRNC